MKKLISVIIVIVLCLSLSLAGCSKSGDKTKLEQILDSGKMTVYTDPNFPPFEYTSGTDIVGVDAEIIKAVAESLGVELVLESAEFDSIITAIATGKADMAISGITITEKRLESVDFSKPYIKSVQYLIVPVDSDIETMEDLAGKRVGAALGYTGQFVIEDEMSATDDYVGVLVDAGVELSFVNSAVEGSNEVINNRLDAVVMDEYVAIKVASNSDKIKAIKLVYADGGEIAEEYGIAVPKGNEDLLEEINAVIDSLIADGKIEEWVIQYS